MEIKEPTLDECSDKEVVFENELMVAYACWYPQMGGYVGKAVAIFDKEWESHSSGSAVGGCIDVLVWHNGEFPFSDVQGNPKKIHHCDGSQFIEFGEFLEKINNKNMIEV